MCPWHRYRINLDNGKQIQRGQGEEKESETQMQRTHFVKVEGEDLMVLLNLEGQEIASDAYANMGLYNHEVQKNPSKMKPEKK